MCSIKLGELQGGIRAFNSSVPHFFCLSNKQCYFNNIFLLCFFFFYNAHREGRETRHSCVTWVLQYTGVTGLVLGIGTEWVLCATGRQSLLWHIYHFNKQGRKMDLGSRDRMTCSWWRSRWVTVAGREPSRAGLQRLAAALHHLASLFDARPVPILISHLWSSGEGFFNGRGTDVVFKHHL